METPLPLWFEADKVSYALRRLKQLALRTRAVGNLCTPKIGNVLFFCFSDDVLREERQ